MSDVATCAYCGAKRLRAEMIITFRGEECASCVGRTWLDASRADARAQNQMALAGQQGIQNVRSIDWHRVNPTAIAQVDTTELRRIQDVQDAEFAKASEAYESFVAETAAGLILSAQLETAKKRIKTLEELETDQHMARTDAEARANRLSDEAGALRSELTLVKAENSDLRRENERLARKAGR